MDAIKVITMDIATRISEEIEIDNISMIKGRSINPSIGEGYRLYIGNIKTIVFYSNKLLSEMTIGDDRYLYSIENNINEIRKMLV